jgi:hypothetical protein
MGLPHLDAFTGTDGTLLRNYNAGWVRTTSGPEFQINTNSAAGQGSEVGVIKWDGDGSFNAAQYATGKIVAITGDQFIGVACRVQTLNSGYYFMGHSDKSIFGYYLAGSPVTIADNLAALNVNDILRMEFDSGGNYICKINGSTVASGSDSTFATGQCGLSTYNGNTSSRIDDIELGNQASSIVIPVFMNQYRQRRS